MILVKVVNLFFFIYNLAWTLTVIISFPLIPLAKSLRFSEKLALRLPMGKPKGQGIWIHALSVGEVLSALPVIISLKQRYPSREIVFTVKTVQGMKIARNELKGKVDLLFPMPLDFWWSIRRAIKRINPSILILVETDIWPGLISQLNNRGSRVILINGRVSPRTFRSYKRFRSLSKKMLNSLDLCLMQSNLDRERFLLAGVAPEKVKVAGNVKFDRVWSPLDEEEHTHWLRILNLRPEQRVWVAGSVHEGEYKIILETYKRLVTHFPDLRLIIAPRKLELTEDIMALSMTMGLRAICKTDLSGTKESYQVLILNTIGELGRLYGLAEISFVGGSLVPVGGHNLLEPASFGCPVIFGPHTHNFVVMSELLIDAKGGKRVMDGEDLFGTMKGLLTTPRRTLEMGRRAKEFVEMNRGAMERIMQYIEGYVKNA